MNIQKFTQKSIEAVNDCERIANEYGNQEIEQEHLIYALLTQEDSLILKLIEKMEIDKVKHGNNLTRYVNAVIKADLDANYEKYLKLQEIMNS